jgi:hypothetical protein
MDFRKSPEKPTAKGKGRKSKSGPLDNYAQKTDNPNFVSNPISRKRSAQEIQAEVDEFDASRWGDTDEEVGGYGPEDGGDEEPIEISDGDDEVTLVGLSNKRRKLSDRGKGPAKVKGKGKAKAGENGDILSAMRPEGRQEQVEEVDRDASGTPVMECLRALTALKKNVSKVDGRESKG